MAWKRWWGNSPGGIFDNIQLGVVQEVDQVVQKFKCLQSFNLLADTFLLAALIQKFLWAAVHCFVGGVGWPAEGDSLHGLRPGHLVGRLSGIWWLHSLLDAWRSWKRRPWGSKTTVWIFGKRKCFGLCWGEYWASIWWRGLPRRYCNTDRSLFLAVNALSYNSVVVDTSWLFHENNVTRRWGSGKAWSRRRSLLHDIQTCKSPETNLEVFWVVLFFLGKPEMVLVHVLNKSSWRWHHDMAHVAWPWHIHLCGGRYKSRSCLNSMFSEFIHLFSLYSLFLNQSVQYLCSP